ncbi:WD40-repeat-containing domain protein [Aspergillus parasiticus]|uniref:WD40-repeat-containing domain protein n=2 Tax=Aspergillus subgen. Circumdati TaxID=2720871 RepID=A0A5N6DGU0_ASPPA|nr:WD40-repeat-containing domain protein [Aspergillus parasiticus]KAE8316341.1 WD40-repeat-containing domain protein [Aspergillus transmontanensis]
MDCLSPSEYKSPRVKPTELLCQVELVVVLCGLTSTPKVAVYLDLYLRPSQVRKRGCMGRNLGGFRRPGMQSASFIMSGGIATILDIVCVPVSIFQAIPLGSVKHALRSASAGLSIYPSEAETSVPLIGFVILNDHCSNMHTLKATASSSLSLAQDNYIYSITSSSPGSFAAIASDDSLRVFDAASLSHVSVVAADAHKGVTSLKSYDAGQQLLATGGRDGRVKLWDLRNGKRSAVVEVETSRDAPVLSIACCPATNSLAAGTELVSYQAVVAFWDVRSPGQSRLQYVESHNDDVTELQYHPTRTNVVLSGSTDGLVNVYNTDITDEDEALVQVINHGSVHHAGFLSERTIYALSHDEVFSIHPATDPEEEVQEPNPVQFGDLRQPLGCEYIAQLCIGSQGPYVAAGHKIEKRLDLVPLTSNPSWQFDQENLWRLPGAHGEEVSQSVFTCGEDGFVRAWKPESGEAQGDESSNKTARPKKNKDKGRFKPY